jgi:hypothetical protein
VTKYYCDRCGVEDEDCLAVKFGTAYTDRNQIKFSLCKPCMVRMFYGLRSTLKGFEFYATSDFVASCASGSGSCGIGSLVVWV